MLARRVNERLSSLLVDYGYDPEEYRREFPRKWVTYGDCVVFPSRCFSSDVWSKLDGRHWEIVVSTFNCRRVALQSAVMQDGVRTPSVRLVVKADGDVWVRKVENKVIYTWDITRCMFSAGNISEKLFMSRLSNVRDEVVVDMYAGIGYFTLPLLVHTAVRRVHACEWNPAAVEALRHNLRLNRVQDRCIIHAGDNRQVCPSGLADRVLLGLIPSSRAGWLTGARALRHCGGLLHVHENVTCPPCHVSRVSSTTTADYNGADSHDPTDACRNVDNVEPIDDASGIDRVSIVDAFDSVDIAGDTDTRSHNAATDKRVDSASVHTAIHDADTPDTAGDIPRGRVLWRCERPACEAWCVWACNTAEHFSRLLGQLRGGDWTVSIERVAEIKSYAPRISHMVLDLRCVAPSGV